MGTLTYRQVQSDLFPKKTRARFLIFEKLQERHIPLTPSPTRQFCDRVIKKVQDVNVEVNLVREWFISGFHKRKSLSNKQLRLLSGGENKIYPIHLIVFHKKYGKNIPIVNSGGEHTWRNEDGVSLLQLWFSCNHEADSRIALHDFKSKAIVVIVLKDKDSLMLLVNNHCTCAISKEYVVKYDKNNYTNLGTICTYLRNTVSRNI